LFTNFVADHNSQFSLASVNNYPKIRLSNGCRSENPDCQLPRPIMRRSRLVRNVARADAGRGLLTVSATEFTLANGTKPNVTQKSSRKRVPRVYKKRECSGVITVEDRVRVSDQVADIFTNVFDVCILRYNL